MIRWFGLFLFSLQIVARAEASVPVVSPATFAPGAAWTWDYVKTDGSIWSTERYTVLSLKGSVVVIEISSDYGGLQNLRPNTRLEVDISKCLQAYSNPVRKRPWSFRMFSLSPSGSEWTAYEPPSTLAFEEKFNCNSHEFTKSSEAYLTVHSIIDETPVFQQKLWGRLTSSWFAQEGPDRSIAIQKKFTADPTQTYVFKLRLQLSKAVFGR